MPPQHHTVAARLAERPGTFDFFQAARVLERLGAGRRRAAAGGDSPDREAVHFRVLPALRFASAPVAKVTVPADQPAELTATFFGLTGPDGVMPQHYTALVLARLRLKDATLRDWLDLFHHRAMSLFVRAWEKTHWPAAVDRRRAERAADDDPITGGTFAVAGFGTPHLRGRLRLPDDVFVYYAGLLSRRPTAAGLEQMLADYFGWPVAVEQLKGHWLYLDDETKAVLPAAGAVGRNTSLGHDVVVGRRVWDVQSKVRVVVGPVDYPSFRQLLPGGDARGPLRDLARLAVGPETDVDVQVLLDPDAVPTAALDYDEAAGPRLGWNTWVRTHGFAAPVGDAVFVAD